MNLKDNLVYTTNSTSTANIPTYTTSASTTATYFQTPSISPQLNTLVEYNALVEYTDFPIKVIVYYNKKTKEVFSIEKTKSLNYKYSDSNVEGEIFFSLKGKLYCDKECTVLAQGLKY